MATVVGLPEMITSHRTTSSEFHYFSHIPIRQHLFNSSHLFLTRRNAHSNLPVTKRVSPALKLYGIRVFVSRCLAELFGKVSLPVIEATTTGFSTMEEVLFELEYTDRTSGERVLKRIADFRLARELAKELAQASGRRAIIHRRRVRRPTRVTYTWSVTLVNAETGSIRKVWRGLSKREVLLRWARWRERKTHSTLVAWPEWMPPLKVELQKTA